MTNTDIDLSFDFAIIYIYGQKQNKSPVLLIKVKTYDNLLPLSLALSLIFRIPSI